MNGESSAEKLEHAKEIIEALEKEVSKLRSSLKRSEGAVQQLQDSSALLSANSNNSSSTFMLPSEFKKNWENLVQERLLDVFSLYIEDHSLFSTLVQSLYTLVLATVTSDLNSKINEFARLLGAELSDHPRIRKHLLKLLQDSSSKAFPGPDTSQLMQRYRAAHQQTMPAAL